ncbi:MAG: methionine ABC transporter substrate-binding protein, partial [Clostridia bacterium]|nr:methionine ABC transporter substrate-binding protein [Clostridia bacterium]
MKNTQKRKSVFIAMALVLSIVLLIATGCDKGKDETKIIVGASPSPHAEILQEIVEDLKKEGVTLEIREFSDYKTPNIALSDGDIDANFFQHIPYFVTENRDGKFGLEILGGVHP